MSGDLPPPDPSQRNLYGPDGPYSPEQPPSYDRLRRVLIAVGGLVMVIFAIGLGFVVLRDNGSGPSSSPTGTAPQAESGSVTSAARPATSTAPTTAAAPTTAVVTIPATAAPTTAAAPPTTAAAPPTTAAAPPTTAAPTSPATAPPPPPTTAPSEEAKALATAQALLDALANGQWNAARTLNPGRNESDAFLQQAYGPIEQATIVPAAVKALSSDRFDMRLGIVSHEAQPAGQQTVLLCSHWQVDAATQTVVRLASTRIRVEGGYVAPSAVSGELTSTCATVPLR
jgi:hypothetical protein